MEQEAIIRLDEINLKLIIKDLLRNIVYLFLAAVTGVLAVYAICEYTYQPLYQSQATMAVVAKGGDGSSYTNLTTASAMADVLAEVFQSDVMKEEIIKYAGKEASQSQITAELIPETNLLLLKVKAQNPEMAYNVISVLLEQYHAVSDYVFGNAVIELIDMPDVPLAPCNRFSTKKYAMLGAALCMMLAAGLIVLCSLLRSTLKSVREAKRKVEGNCIGIVGHEKKNRTWKARIRKRRKGLLIDDAAAGFWFGEEFHQLAEHLESFNQTGEKKVILVNSVAENEGKTTVAANLALALAEKDKNVLLVDLDLRKPSQYKLFEKKEEQSPELVEYLKGEADTWKMVSYDKNPHLTQAFCKKPVKNPQSILNSQRLRYFLSEAGKTMDYVIVDAPPLDSGTDAQRMNELCDASILVVRWDYVPVSDINDAIESLRDGKSEYLGYVLNDFEHKKGGYGYGYGYEQRGRNN